MGPVGTYPAAVLPGRPVPLPPDPLAVFAAWPPDRPVAFLHSGRTDARRARFSVIAEPVDTLRCGPANPPAAGRSDEPTRDPVARLNDRVTGDDAAWLGYLGYELAHRLEPAVGPRRPDPPAGLDPEDAWPDLCFHRCPVRWTFDHVAGTWTVHGGDPARPPARPPAAPAAGPGFTAGRPSPDEPRPAHEARVRRALDYIAAGDVFQVNLAHRFTAPFSGCPRSLYAALAAASPAWYGAYVEIPPDAACPRVRAVVSTSPELFLSVAPDGTVTTRPIKGTRPADADADTAADLRASDKDAAELNMIVDLMRNDLGRVCRYGSVRVSERRTVESHPTVHHGVATVTGRLRPDRDLGDLLRATFPAGSVTGAPKVRAMQIIRELEAGPRGPYCGAIGVVRPDERRNPPDAPAEARRPSADLSVAIRTLLVDPGDADTPGTARFHVGGGVVADSDPADEYEETLHKAAAMHAALRAGTPAPA